MPITLLAVDDNPGDVRLLKEMLSEEDGQCTTLLLAASMAEAEAILERQPVDIILLDLGLPDVQGLDAVRHARALAPRLPLVVMTGLDDEAIAGQALHEGAQDYIIKGQVDMRGRSRALRYAVERKAMEDKARDLSQQIEHAALHDHLTGLPNRTLLNDRIDQAIAKASRHKSKLAILFLDLDRFKHINDSLGHPTGDKLLRSVAERLLNCVRDTDTVCRLGGDEFVVLLSDVVTADDAATSTARILAAMAQVHAINGHDLYITASVGISIYPDDGKTAETLMKNADTAMYQAKVLGKDTFQFFKAEMNQRAVERQSTETALRLALQRREFELHYQPVIDLATGLTSGVEALIRWNHPTRGLIGPAQFIPIAEACRLIVPIGEWVLGEACRQAQSWARAGLWCGTMAVNVSAIQFREHSFVQSVMDVLAATGMDPRRLELELTESVLMTTGDCAAAALQTLRNKGVKVALDDFGTGYSSLSYLGRFPVDNVKIDQAFIRQIGAGGAKKALLSAIITMGHALGLRVVAEGVETEKELQFIKDCGCDEVQGYYFGRPLALKAFRERLLQEADRTAFAAG